MVQTAKRINWSQISSTSIMSLWQPWDQGPVLVARRGDFGLQPSIHNLSCRALWSSPEMSRRPKTSADPRSNRLRYTARVHRPPDIKGCWIRDQLSYGKRISPAGHSTAISNTTDPRTLRVMHNHFYARRGSRVQGSVVNTQYLKWYRHSS